MTKQEAIQKAYGEHWEAVKDYVDENGNLDKRLFISNSGLKYADFDKILFEHFTDFTCRPKSLQGIETNNGWIKIESEDDLPKEKCACWIIDKQIGLTSGEFLNNSQEEKVFWSNNATHYQPILKPQPPIY